jgi:hypothetical protein
MGNPMVVNTIWTIVFVDILHGWSQQ